MAANISKLVKPPIALFGMEGSYINALFSAASKKNVLTAVEGDLSTVSGLYQSIPKFKDFITDPFIKPEQKHKVFSKLKLNDISVNFLTAMAENNRIKHLPALQKTFARAMAASRKEVMCIVMSAKPMTDAKKKEIEESLKGFTNKKLLIKYEVDSSLMGGLIVNFNDEHLIDMSIKSKVRNITSALSAN